MCSFIYLVLAWMVDLHKLHFCFIEMNLKFVSFKNKEKFEYGKNVKNFWRISYFPKDTESSLLLLPRLSLTFTAFLFWFLLFLFLFLLLCRRLPPPFGLLLLLLFGTLLPWFLWPLVSPICLWIQSRYLSTLVYTL